MTSMSSRIAASGLVFGWVAATAHLFAAEAGKPSDHLIRVGPNASTLSEAEPAHLSIKQGNSIRWVADHTLWLSFPVADFPALDDGTRVTLPPLAGMVLNSSKTKWFAAGGDHAVQGGRVNADLLPLLARAKKHVLIYKYRIVLGGRHEGSGYVVIQE